MSSTQRLIGVLLSTSTCWWYRRPVKFVSFEVYEIQLLFELTGRFTGYWDNDFFSAATQVLAYCNEDTVKELQYSQPEPESQGSSERGQEWWEVESGKVSDGCVHFVVEGNVNPWDVHFAGGFVKLVHENCLDQCLNAGQGAAWQQRLNESGII